MNLQTIAQKNERKSLYAHFCFYGFVSIKTLIRYWQLIILFLKQKKRMV
jgi:hypothetical protein